MKFVSRMSVDQVERIKREFLDALHAGEDAIVLFAEAQGLSRRDVPPEVEKRILDEHLRGVAKWLAGPET